MKVLVTGSSGHLGEALVRTLTELGHEVAGFDITARPFTNYVGSITDRASVRHCMAGVQAVFHAATLHKPTSPRTPARTSSIRTSPAHSICWKRRWWLASNR